MKRYATQHEQMSVLLLDSSGQVADSSVAKRSMFASGLPTIKRDAGTNGERIAKGDATAIEVTLGSVGIPTELYFDLHGERQNSALGIAVRVEDTILGYILAGSIGGAPSAAKRDFVSLLAATLTGAYRAWADAQQQSRLIEEQRAIVEHIGDGLLVLNRDGTIRYTSAAATRMLRLPAKSVGRPLRDLLDFDMVINSVFTTGIGYADRELIIDSPQRHLHIFDTAIPIKNGAGEVVSVVNTFREVERVRKVASRYAGSHARYTFESLVGRSQALLAAIDAARSAAKGSANVLLEGESGVGKEVFAQAIHNASKRATQPFVAVNCSALPRDLVESELFGYLPGSFTGAAREGRPGKFESAHGGTIFLDEISELPMNAQAKLLRVIQEREVVRIGDTAGIPIDVRIICASNRELRTMVARNEFRSDLFYRCNVLGIQIPALRERTSDIPVLADYFLAKYARLLNKPACRLTRSAIADALAYSWPGNIRELENTIERIVNLSEAVEVDSLRNWLDAGVEQAHLEPGNVVVGSARKVQVDVRPLRDQEGTAVRQALEACRFNVTRCASLLGISKPALYAKIKRYRIVLERPI